MSPRKMSQWNYFHDTDAPRLISWLSVNIVSLFKILRLFPKLFVKLTAAACKAKLKLKFGCPKVNSANTLVYILPKPALLI